VASLNTHAGDVMPALVTIGRSPTLPVHTNIVLADFGVAS